MIGGSLVGLELAEFLAERGRKVTLLHESQQLGLPLAMLRRWTEVKLAREHGVDIQRRVTVTRISEPTVAWTDAKGRSKSAPADMVTCADGTTAAAPLAGELAPRASNARLWASLARSATSTVRSTRRGRWLLSDRRAKLLGSPAVTERLILVSSSFVVSISPGMAENWRICRDNKLWGVRGRGSAWKAVAARVEKGDELFVWRSGKSNGFIARVVATGPAIFAGQPGFRSPWTLTSDFGAVIPFKLKRELGTPVSESFATPGRIGAKFGFNNALLHHGIAQVTPKTANKIRDAIALGN